MHDSAKHLMEAIEKFSAMISEDPKAAAAVRAKRDQESPMHPVETAIKAGDGTSTVRG